MSATGLAAQAVNAHGQHPATIPPGMNVIGVHLAIGAGRLEVDIRTDTMLQRTAWLAAAAASRPDWIVVFWSLSGGQPVGMVTADYDVQRDRLAVVSICTPGQLKLRTPIRLLRPGEPALIEQCSRDQVATSSAVDSSVVITVPLHDLSLAARFKWIAYVAWTDAATSDRFLATLPTQPTDYEGWPPNRVVFPSSA